MCRYLIKQHQTFRKIAYIDVVTKSQTLAETFGLFSPYNYNRLPTKTKLFAVVLVTTTHHLVLLKTFLDMYNVAYSFTYTMHGISTFSLQS